eukprot:6341783-Ditylum_brightwellii.AAC.1
MKHLNSRVVFDDAVFPADEKMFVRDNLSDFYTNIGEEPPPGTPEQLGLPVTMSVFVDANHTGSLLNRRLHTGLILFVNNAVIDWFSKAQNTVESSTFGSESVAMHLGINKVKALRYKLQMMGVLIDEPCDVYCDNKAL